MKIGWREIKVDGKTIKAKVTTLERWDKRRLRRLYFSWLKLNKAIKKISTRGINLPEAISENAFCLFFPCVRIIKLAKGKCSYDCINLETGSRIQIKASSVGSDLTSFGPKSQWDELYFLDFSKEDGSFKVYKIEKEWIYNYKVNKSQTFAEQQAEARRPRFSIVDRIIKPKSLKPIRICKL